MGGWELRKEEGVEVLRSGGSHGKKCIQVCYSSAQLQRSIKSMQKQSILEQSKFKKFLSPRRRDSARNYAAGLHCH